MAYNPYFNPYYQQPTPQFYNNGAMPDALSQMKGQYQQPMHNIPAPTNDMIWVLGEVEAQSYPVAPNNTVTLWDKNQKTIYIKSANAQGVPSMQILDFTERVQNGSQMPVEHTCKCGDNFVTKDELKTLQGKYDELIAKYDDLMSKLTDKPKTTSKKSKDSDE
jgi:hypothetical protein